jgi:hypothetical protein
MFARFSLIFSFGLKSNFFVYLFVFKLFFLKKHLNQSITMEIAYNQAFDQSFVGKKMKATTLHAC